MANTRLGQLSTLSISLISRFFVRIIQITFLMCPLRLLRTLLLRLFLQCLQSFNLILLLRNRLQRNQFHPCLNLKPSIIKIERLISTRIQLVLSDDLDGPLDVFQKLRLKLLIVQLSLQKIQHPFNIRRHPRTLFLLHLDHFNLRPLLISLLFHFRTNFYQSQNTEQCDETEVEITNLKSK